MTQIRFATKEDIPLIFQFIKDLASYEKLAHEVVATEQILLDSLFGKKSHAEVLLAYENDKPAGFALFFHNFSTFTGRPGVYLEDLYVKEEFRGSGIGYALLEKLATICKERNCPRLEWWVLDWNQKAIDFYKKIGAKPMDEWTVFRTTDPELSQLAKSLKNKL